MDFKETPLIIINIPESLTQKLDEISWDMEDVYQKPLSQYLDLNKVAINLLSYLEEKNIRGFEKRVPIINVLIEIHHQQNYENIL